MKQILPLIDFCSFIDFFIYLTNIFFLTLSVSNTTKLKLLNSLLQEISEKNPACRPLGGPNLVTQEKCKDQLKSRGVALQLPLGCQEAVEVYLVVVVVVGWELG